MPDQRGGGLPSWDAIRDGRVPLATREALEPGPSPRRGRAGTAATGAERELLSFRLAGEEYALDIRRIREIIKPAPLTEVPRAPGFVPGVLSVRGTIVPVVDLRLRLRLGAADPDKRTRILIVTKDGELYGLWVDEVRQVERIRLGEIEPPPPVLGGLDAELLTGIARSSGRLLILLDLDAVLTFEVLR